MKYLDYQVCSFGKVLNVWQTHSMRNACCRRQRWSNWVILSAHLEKCLMSGRHILADTFNEKCLLVKIVNQHKLFLFDWDDAIVSMNKTIDLFVFYINENTYFCQVLNAELVLVWTHTFSLNIKEALLLRYKGFL